MKDDRLLDDQDLKAAFHSVRAAYDGENPDANLTLQRALFRTRTRERRSRATRWVVLPIAAVLAASTAWAGVTGKLTPAVQSMLEAFHAERTPPPSPVVVGPVAPTGMSVAAASPVASAEPPPSVETTTRGESTSPPSTEPAPSVVNRPPPAEVAARPSPVAHAAPVASQPLVKGTSRDDAHRSVDPPASPAPSASAADPHAALFAEAHRLHFTERNPAVALAAWDRYLAADPNGRFSPEARYNRALALVRLGRHTEARSELTAFANGTYGGYRREEAKALLDALSRDASPL